MHNEEVNWKHIATTSITWLINWVNPLFAAIRFITFHFSYSQSVALHHLHRQTPYETEYTSVIQRKNEDRAKQHLHGGQFEGEVLNFYSMSTMSTPQFTLISILYYPPHKFTPAHIWCINRFIQIQYLGILASQQIQAYLAPPLRVFYNQDDTSGRCCWEQCCVQYARP